MLTTSCCAVQYLELTLDVEQKMHVLLSLSFDCRLQMTDADSSCCAVHYLELTPDIEQKLHVLMR